MAEISAPQPDLAVVKAADLTATERSAILDLCSRAYDMDYEPLFRTLTGAVHVLARQGGLLVSHALWVRRWLQAGDLPPLRTAYVEAVATEAVYRRQGFASAVMRQLAAEIAGFELGALSPAEQGFYSRLGWEPWRGPLAIRMPGGSSRQSRELPRQNRGLLPTPGEGVMILRLPHTPPSLDLDTSLSAEWREGELW